MRKIIIVFVLLATIFSAKNSLALDDPCECTVGNLKGNGEACSIIWYVANQDTLLCPVINFESGLSGTIDLKQGIGIMSNKTRIVGPVDSNGNPKVTIVGSSTIPAEYIIHLAGTHTGDLPTLENLNIQASGKKAIYIDGSEHILKNVRVSNSKIGAEIVGSKNQITGAGNKFENNSEAGIKIIKGDNNNISQAEFELNGQNAIVRDKDKKSDYGNSASSFKRAHGMAVVGLLVSGQKVPVGVTGFADKDIYPDDNYVAGKIELFKADTTKLSNDMGQGTDYLLGKESSLWAWGMVNADDNTTRRFGVTAGGLLAGPYYTLTSIAHKTAGDETTEFSNTFSAVNNWIKGGPACLSPNLKELWYLKALDGYYMDGGAQANCFKLENNELKAATCVDNDPWPLDSDKDGIPNFQEDKNFNCVFEKSAGETDPADPEDGLPGDNDNDKDNDDVMDDKDNCPPVAECTDGTQDACDTTYNPDQDDADHDGIGDICDDTNDDKDNDYVNDDVDNCPPVAECITGTEDICDSTYNPDQDDFDKDGIGDACDEPVDNDSDKDGVPNDIDNCPEPNANQWNYDLDARGDACDNCMKLKNDDQSDTDTDGIGDVCDFADIGACAADNSVVGKESYDGDDRIDSENCDNCPDDDNQDQTDADKDGAGDICDNCATESNAEQDDLDSDFIGDVCDPDMDGDTWPNVGDNCPSVYNKDQADSDADGDGNRCDIDPSISPDINTESNASAFGDIEGGGGHVSSQGGCSSNIGLVAASGVPNLLISIVLLGSPMTTIFVKRRFYK